jgi:MFS family permease
VKASQRQNINGEGNMVKQSSQQGRQPVRAAAAAFIGTAVEFYDFYVYGMAAALVLGLLFFPTSDAFTATLASFATFAVAFIAKPLSGLVFGHLGDRLGRKKMLLLTMFLMAFATIGVGLLPTYATIGIWAPIALIVLRFAQGISQGGEWGGAVLMAAEHAPPKRVMFFASFAQLGSPAGLLMALLMFRAVSTLPQQDFLAWGWRVPFLASFVLLIIGLVIRASVTESPDFEQVSRAGKIARFPVAEAIRTAWYPILLAAGISVIGTGGFYFTNVFLVSYVTQHLSLDRTMVLDCLLYVTIIQFISQPISALVAERIGDARFLKLAAAFGMLVPYPMFVLVSSGVPLTIVLGISLAVVTLAGVYAVMAGYLSAAFPPRIRYSCISIGYQLGSAVSAGATPLVATTLAFHYQGQWLPLALFFSALSGISLLSIVAFAHWRRGYDDAPGLHPISETR